MSACDLEVCMEFLDSLSDSKRALLLDRSVERDLVADDVIHLAGDPGDRVHLVMDGLVKLTVRDSEGEETILGLTPAGGVVGDLAAIDGRPQPVDAVAISTCTVRGLDSALFVETVFAEPLAAQELARHQAARTRWVMETALERTSGEVAARLAGRLLDLGKMLGRRASDESIAMELPLGQRDLGKLSGMCRESVCKTLRRLKQDGVVDYDGRKLRILRPDSLQLMRCGVGD
jgi:CRP/FNR family transcriptional regulator, cyclic AMP receptor protein